MTDIELEEARSDIAYYISVIRESLDCIEEDYNDETAKTALYKAVEGYREADAAYDDLMHPYTEWDEADKIVDRRLERRLGL